VKTIRAYKLFKRYRRSKSRALLPVPALISARAKPRPEIWALRNVSFKAAEGEVFGIIGPNGAGKSTLLKILARVTPPTAGRVEIFGRVIPLLELGAAFQRESTGRENVMLAAALHGVPHRVVNARIEELFDFAGLSDYVDVPVGKYSSGMYLRLAFSMAVVMEPQVLLADEVLAVGDATFQHQAMQRLRRQTREDGLTVLFVSHDMAAVRGLCHRVMWLDRGSVRELGSTQRVVDHYEEAAFLAAHDDGDAGIPGAVRHSKYGEVVSAKLVDSQGQEIGAVRVDTEFRVRIIARLAIAGSRARGVVTLSSPGRGALQTAPSPFVDVEEPGLFTLQARIPPGLLADIPYTLTATVLVTHGDRQRALVRHNALSFTAFDPAEGESMRGSKTGPGAERSLVRPLVDWEIERANGAGADASSAAAAAAAEPGTG